MAAIRTVLHRQFGVQVAEAALVTLGTRPEAPIVREGSSSGEMRRAVHGASKAYNQAKPWTIRTRRQGTFRQLQNVLRQGRWPIVQVFVPSVDSHHVVVVTAVAPDRVQYYDPDSTGRKLQWMARSRFADWWVSPVTGEYWFAVINGGSLKEY